MSVTNNSLSKDYPHKNNHARQTIYVTVGAWEGQFKVVYDYRRCTVLRRFHSWSLCFASSGSSAESSSSDDNQDDGNGDDKKDDPEVVIEDKTGMQADPAQGALASIMVPEVFPEVPLLPVHKSPVFPRFVKMMEVGKVILND